MDEADPSVKLVAPIVKSPLVKVRFPLTVKA